jgi:hypothetical protein
VVKIIKNVQVKIVSKLKKCLFDEVIIVVDKNMHVTSEPIRVQLPMLLRIRIVTQGFK